MNINKIESNIKIFSNNIRKIGNKIDLGINIIPNITLDIIKSKLKRDNISEKVLEYIKSVNIDKSIIEKIRLDKTSNPLINDIPRKDNIRFFSWKFSYFSGKVRSYLRYKSNKCGFVIEEILATPEIITNILVVSTGMNTVPQIQLDDGRMIHDSSNIIER